MYSVLQKFQIDQGIFNRSVLFSNVIPKKGSNSDNKSIHPIKYHFLGHLNLLYIFSIRNLITVTTLFKTSIQYICNLMYPFCNFTVMLFRIKYASIWSLDFSYDVFLVQGVFQSSKPFKSWWLVEYLLNNFQTKQYILPEEGK